MAATIFSGSYIKTLKNALRLGSLSAAPSSPAAGDIYYNSTDTNLNFHNGTAFVALGNGGIITDWQDAGAINLTATTTAPTKSSNIVADYVKWRRVGSNAEIVMYYEQSSTTGTTAGSGDYLFNLPSGLVIDTNVIKASSAFTGAGAVDAGAIIGTSSVKEPASNNSTGYVQVYSSTAVRAVGRAAGALGTFGSGWFPITTSATKNFWLHFTVPIVGWSAINTVSSAIQAMNVVSKTTTYTASTADDLILCSGSAFTVTLPAAATQPGKILTIKKTDSSASNIITVDGNASETIEGSLTIQLARPGDYIKIVSDGTNWTLLDSKISAYCHYHTTAGFGSGASAIRYYAVLAESYGNCFTLDNSSTTGLSVTVNFDGIYSFSYSEVFNSLDIAGLTLNATGELSTAVPNVTAAKILAMSSTPAADHLCNVTWTGHLKVGDVIRPHTRGAGASSVPARGHFTASRVG